MEEQHNEEKESNTRTRVKLTQSTKGIISWEISAEYDTPEKSIEMLGQAIDKVKTLLKEKGLKEASEVA